MNLTKLTTSTIIALAVALPAGQVWSQEKEPNVNTTLDQTEQNIDSIGDNLKDTDKTVDQTVDTVKTTGEATVDSLKDADKTVDQTVDTVKTTDEATVDSLKDTDKTVDQTVDTVKTTDETAVDSLKDNDKIVDTVKTTYEEELAPITLEEDANVDEVAETSTVVEEKFNWGWLGLLGLLGLFGLTGRNNKTQVAHHDAGLETVIDTDNVNNTDVNNTTIHK